MEDDKERNRSDDDAGDNDQQEGTAEGWSFVGRRDGGGCHGWLDAKSTRVRFFFLVRWSNAFPAVVRGEKLQDRNFIAS
jgi:hypothetical protein